MGRRTGAARVSTTVSGRRASGGDVSTMIVAKRSSKKRQARKLEKRDEVREMQRWMEEREAAAAEAAAYRPEPPPPPEDPAAAAQRILAARESFHEALETVKEKKQEAMDSGDYEQSRGFKPFPEVQDAVRALALAKIAVYEAHLERALALLSQTKSEPPSTLEKFDWIYEKGVVESNVRCLGFMLAALIKNNVSSGVAEVLWVAGENATLAEMDPKTIARAVNLLDDLDSMGLLDEGEPEVLAATKEAMAQET